MIFTLRLETKEFRGAATANTTIPANADHPRMLTKQVRGDNRNIEQEHLLVKEDGRNKDLERSAVDKVRTADSVGNPGRIT